MSKPITPAQISAIHVLISKSEHKDHKADVILGYTNGRTSSSKDMTCEEARELIGYLKSMNPLEKKAENMRKKIISLAHEMGWEHEDGTANMDRINGWCKHFGYMKKNLDKYVYEELPTLVTQFENVYRDYLKEL